MSTGGDGQLVAGARLGAGPSSAELGARGERAKREAPALADGARPLGDQGPENHVRAFEEPCRGCNGTDRPGSGLRPLSHPSHAPC